MVVSGLRVGDCRDQVRPFTGAVIGGVCTAIALMGFWSRDSRMLTTASIATAAAFSLSAILVYNWTYTGDMRVSPYAALEGGGMSRKYLSIC